MANFNLNDYETVAERIKRFYTDYPEGRIITKNQTTKQDRLASTWVVRASIYIPNPLFELDRVYEQFVLKATGLAFEVDGQGMANKTSALENAETSAIGRALANAGYSGNKRTTREEMAKAERGVTPKAPARDWVKEAEDLAWKEDIDGLRKLFTEADRLKVGDDVLNKIKELGNGHKGSKDTAN
jgi:hypothetical protein